MTQNADHAVITERLNDLVKVEAALKRAAREAVLRHARAGQKIAVWRDNQVAWEDPIVDATTTTAE